MMEYYRPGGYRMLTPVVKNLLIINVIFFIMTYVILSVFHYDITKDLGLYFIKSDNFRPYQFITHMFMHGNFGHLFFNMFALWMFGKNIEVVWGPKRFLIYYFVTGLGAAAFHTLVNYISYSSNLNMLTEEQMQYIYTNGPDLWLSGQTFTIESMKKIHILLNVPTVGASGAVFGLLLAFGMLFPNALIYVYFAIPLRAKYFVLLYGLLELYAGVLNQQGDNIAHFAHLGGMIFGLLFILLWKKYKFQRWD